MNNNTHRNKKFLPELFLVVLSAILIYRIAPGFRPKEFKQLLQSLGSDRGLGLMVNLAFISALIPAALKVKRICSFQSVIFSFFSLIGIFISLDILFEFTLLNHGLSQWILRIVVFSIIIWGWRSYEKKSFQKEFFAWRQSESLSPITQFCFFLIVFLSFREALHYFFTRPLNPFGDEISWWQTGSKELMNYGLHEGLRIHWYGNYIPGIPWLISLPARLVGSHREEWLWAYAPTITALGFLLLCELAKTRLALFAGFTLLFCALSFSRDLHFMFAGSLYGEATASLLLAVFVWELVKLNPTNLLKAFLFGSFLVFARFSKPPVSSLVWMSFFPLFGFLVIRDFAKWRTFAGLSFLTGFVPYQIWFWGLGRLGKTPEYSFSLKDFAEKGLDLSVPLNMLAGLFNVGSPQFSYTLGLIAALFLACMVKATRYLLSAGVLLFFYWGFVLGLYATLWNRGEYGSAGRYLSHAAVALMLLLPTAFNHFSDKERI